MKLNKAKIINFIKTLIKTIDKKTVFIAAITTLMIIYFIDPLKNVEISTWDRTFSTAMRIGISISKRVNNFYILICLLMPISCLILTGIYGLIFKNRETYQNTFFNISIIMIMPIIVSFISRYIEQSTGNILLETMLYFLGVIAITAIFDKKEKLSKQYILMLCGVYLVGIITLNILLKPDYLIEAVRIMSIILLIYNIFTVKTKLGEKYFEYLYRCLLCFTWIPTLIYVTREIFFILNEKGFKIMKYYTNISIIAFFLGVLVPIIVMFFLRKKKMSFLTFGCLGIIISLCFTQYFSDDYQYKINYKDYKQVYEAANVSVAADTIREGKIPIIDNFSAHALSDTWTAMLYSFIHSDVNGIFVDPYSGLSCIIGVVILFFILRNFFEEDTTLLIVCLFPFAIRGIKAISICLISVVALLNALKKNTNRSYLMFWLSALLSAFYVYDEGMALGIACILAFLIVNIVNKQWKTIKKFICIGMLVGGIALATYFIYCSCTGILAILRIKEWISVSLKSSTSWATYKFGEPTQFEFLLSYFIVPICAMVLLIVVTGKYILKRDKKNIASLVIVFSITQLLYISRTIVYHNLLTCNGRTGVLLNFVHWTISFYALYQVHKTSKEKSILVWTVTFGLVVILEGMLVTSIYPVGATLYEGALAKSTTTKLSNNMDNIWGKKRIVYEEETRKFVKGFQQIFDTLLDKDDTFLDFANITSLYAMTGRQRPCYVSQMPSLLTDLYSQETFLKEISEYDIPLAIIGNSNKGYTIHMCDIAHNVRYYKIAEYIYQNYRPLVLTKDFAIWCKNEYYNEYKDILEKQEFIEEYTLVDYGYDFTSETVDEEGIITYKYQPVHQYFLEQIPYIWANYDKYDAKNNKELAQAYSDEDNIYCFEGAELTRKQDGNYILFECTNSTEKQEYTTVILFDSKNPGARFEYKITVLPETNQYLIRVSEDYFWYAFNIDSICFKSESDEIKIEEVKILEGD